MLFDVADSYTQRSFQVAITFMIFAMMERFLHIPYASWIIFLSGVIYIGFNSGTVIKRAGLLLTGSSVGVAAVLIVRHFLYWDFRLASIFLVTIIGLTIFFCALPYNRFVIWVTLFSDFILQWGDSSSINIQNYAMDRMMCVVIVISVCVLIEHLWFGSKNITYLNYQELRAELQKAVVNLWQLMQEKKATHAKILKNIQAIIAKTDHLNQLVNDINYEYAHHYQFTPEEKQAGKNVLQALRQIVSLYYLQINDVSNAQLPLLKMQAQKAMDDLLC